MCYNGLGHTCTLVSRILITNKILTILHKYNYVKFNKNCMYANGCIADISCWMSQNGLKLNHETTEWIIII